ncbi:MAG TPA: VWA domain-containing protein [Kofleriaceae bacterium]
MTFATPALLALAIGGPLAVLALWTYDASERARLSAQLGDASVLAKVFATASPRRRNLKAILAALAIGLVGFAAARPRIEGKRRVELRGLDLVVAVDVSKSMLVPDVGPTTEMLARKVLPNRLGRARELARAVIDQLAGDRIAPMVFAAAVSHYPLTEDRQVAADFVRDLGPADLPQGSNLGEVFHVGRCLLRPDLYEDLGCSALGRRGHGGDPLHGESLDPPNVKHGDDDDQLEQKTERGKAILVITDGGDTDAATLKEVATDRELGIAIIVVGVGTARGGSVPEINPVTGVPNGELKHLPDGSIVTSKRDDAGMAQLAEAAGDPKRYFKASEVGELDPQPIVDALRSVNRGLATKRVKEQKDIYQPFLFAGLMLLVIDAAIGTRKRQRYPEAA